MTFAGRLYVPTAVSCVFLLGWIAQTVAAPPEARERETHIRAGLGRTIVAVKPGSSAPAGRATQAATRYAYPRPRMAGFSPLIAITTSKEGHPLGEAYYSHDLQDSYVGEPFNLPANENFVIGYLDSGASVDLAAGSFAALLGLTGTYLTPNTIAFVGVGDPGEGTITYPVGFFGAGLSAVNANGTLDLNAVVGHTNVCGVKAEAVDCGGGEALTAVLGLPFMSFRNSFINVDTPQSVIVDGVTYTGPDVQFQDQLYPLPYTAHTITMQYAGELYYVDGAGYFYDLANPLDPTPAVPTTMAAYGLPVGGAFFTTIYVLEGEPGPTNPAEPMYVLVDTGAQSSIMGLRMKNALSLPHESDFTVDVCGLGGLVTDVPAYYIDYVKISAGGGALEFSQAPFVWIDLNFPGVGALDGILGMNFFWNRNVIFEPALAGALGTLHVSDPIPVAYGDYDVDFDVDTADAMIYVSCLTGPKTETVSVNPECTHFDGDEDDDVDLTDFARFQSCFSGSDNTADPACGD
ncbi:MAG: aspartyl protease family protein [Planctomycetota bacterium]|jgi:hypothetical protein